MSNLLHSINNYIGIRHIPGLTAAALIEPDNTVILEAEAQRLKPRVEPGFTSLRQIHFIARAIKNKFGVDTSIVLADVDANRLRLDLRNYLSQHFPQQITNVSVVRETTNAAVAWLYSGERLDDNLAESIKVYTKSFLADRFSLQDVLVEIVGPGDPEPSLVAILRSVKLIAPGSIVAVEADLRDRKFACPSQKWLMSRLDAARKRGLVQRNHDGAYALTAAGLEAVPSGRSRNSSDIQRILLLARRRQW